MKNLRYNALDRLCPPIRLPHWRSPMKSSRMIAAVSTAALGVGSACFADVEITPVKIGQPAPPIEISHWLKGQPVSQFEPGQVYVLEFWATWCGPCKASMPHLSKLQQEMKDYDVTILGVSDEELQTVVKFLASPDRNDEDRLWFEKVDYTLATDPDRSVYEAYMYGVGARGIPTSFIIGKDGKIEWSGHPMELDEPLSAVVKDTWDREKFAKEFEPQAEEARAELAKMLTEQAKTKPHRDALKKARQDKNWPAALSAIDELIAVDEEAFGPRMTKFTILLVDMNKPTDAYAYGEELVEFAWDSPQYLNQVAWFVVDDAKVQTRDLDFAMKAAKRATELTEAREGAILDTVARIYFEQGELKEAVKWQKKAVENAPPGPMATELKDTLKRYEDELSRKGH
jgi:thiol-disulfide isomerase/thioredoxin